MRKKKIKALCLKDYPHAKFATWVANGLKDIETRKWKPKGFKEGMELDILICCSKSSASNNAGKALCIVTLYHIEPMTREHEERAMVEVYPRNKKGDPCWAWFLKNRRLLSKKFKIDGRLSLFDIALPKGIKFKKTKPHYALELPITQRKGLLF